jgi:hypothetical protein
VTSRPRSKVSFGHVAFTAVGRCALSRFPRNHRVHTPTSVAISPSSGYRALRNALQASDLPDWAGAPGSSAEACDPPALPASRPAGGRSRGSYLGSAASPGPSTARRPSGLGARPRADLLAATAGPRCWRVMSGISSYDDGLPDDLPVGERSAAKRPIEVGAFGHAATAALESGSSRPVRASKSRGSLDTGEGGEGRW